MESLIFSIKKTISFSIRLIKMIRYHEMFSQRRTPIYQINDKNYVNDLTPSPPHVAL